MRRRKNRHILWLLLLVVFGLSPSLALSAENTNNNNANSQTNSNNSNSNNSNNSNNGNGNTVGSTTPAAAQTKVVSAPPSLVVAETSGGVEKRNLLLQFTEPVTIKQIISTDLTRADGRGVLGADKIKAASLDQAAGDLQRIEYTFDLKDAPAGEFSGDTRVVYSKGVQSVPVVVRIKHGWFFPLLILLAGICLGAALTAYRTRGRLRDEVLILLGRLRAQMRSDAELAEPFKDRINNYLTDVQVALDAEKWADAQTSIERAQKVFNTWGKYRQSWVELLAYQATLAAQVQRLKAEKAGVPSPFLLKLQRGLDDAVQEASGADDPKPLRDKLDEAWQRINNYVEVQTKINELKGLIAQLPATTALDVVKTWTAKGRELELRLDNLQPTDAAYATAYEKVRGDVELNLAELSKLIPSKLNDVSLGMADAHPLSPPSLKGFKAARGAAADAERRLRIFTKVSYVVALILLAGMGFGELYIARATFGANAWADYFAMFAWGFGAEATRASVAQTVKSWGLPGLSA
ncbi:MAG TPA: hypothetical protein VGX92_01145 [Pyrinomonadaceae bacterium]|jgi:hypothetical protein|nr:hypothetical protein [Pyrinomonadaceae bacterium]